MKGILYILVVFGLFGFFNKDRNNDIAGLYGKCEKGFFACEQVLINADSTFEYGLFYDVGGWNYWKGAWTQKGDTLILNSYNQPIDSTGIAQAKNAFSFSYSGHIIDLMCIIKKNRMYMWDFHEKKISKKRYLKKTQIENKVFEIE